MNKNAHATCQPLRILIAHKCNDEALSIISEVDRAQASVIIKRTAVKEDCLELINHFHPNVVIADYDFGVFPFINEVREKNADIPFIIISELELLQNAPKQGLNIYVLKSDLSRIPAWIDTLQSAGVFDEPTADRELQVNHFRKVTEPRPISSTPRAPQVHSYGHEQTLTQKSEIGNGNRGRAATDSIQQWTFELEQKMEQSSNALKMKSSRIDPLFPSAES